MNHEEFYYEEEVGYGRLYNKALVKRLLPFFKKYQGKILLAGLLLLFSSLFSILGPILLKHAIDVDIKLGNFTGLLRTTILYLLIQTAILVTDYFQRTGLMVTGEKAVADIKQSVFSHLLSLPVSFFDHNPVGRLITRVESDTEALKTLFTATSVVILQDLVMLVGMSVVMIIVNVKLYLIIFLLLPVFIFTLWRFQRRVRPIYIQIRKKIADMNNLVSESLKGLAVIQAFNREETFARKLDRLGGKKYAMEKAVSTLWYRIWFLVDFGEVLGLTFVLGLGGLWALKGQLTIGTLFLFVSYIARLFGPLRGLSDQINVMQRAFAAAERLFSILDTKPEEELLKEESIKFNTRINFSGVNFAYTDRETTLKGVSLDINRGEKIALVGETGGGKTSLVSLLLKFYRPQEGRIAIDGQDITEINKKDLRRLFGFVPQDVILFPGSVLENLRLFDKTIPPVKVHQAAERARIHKIILDFPAGYETNLIERGINLSAGERQLLSFARALVFDPEILILDEATSSVDPHTEHLIQEGLEELLKDRTAIIIAHRLSTIRRADRIFVVHRGEIIESGNHLELMRQRGYYARLYKLQYLKERG
ncbi:MAG: ABC transporter ATP-binding protein [Candidatus Edwardsbacteria bacterium]